MKTRKIEELYALAPKKYGMYNEMEMIAWQVSNGGDSLSMGQGLMVFFCSGG